ncbi:MAG: DUF721 domain-containing protein [Planctomycetaceae bacterium]|nr:DUF721 domain-containing protein [Planctomycetaceae bacterium]
MTDCPGMRSVTSSRRSAADETDAASGRPKLGQFATPDPAQLGDVLSELFARRGYGRAQGDRQLRDAWSAIAGDSIAKQTRVLGLRHGVLQIAVTSSALLSQLVSFQRVELLGQLQTQHPDLKIRDLKFKLQGRKK